MIGEQTPSGSDRHRLGGPDAGGDDDRGSRARHDQRAAAQNGRDFEEIREALLARSRTSSTASRARWSGRSRSCRRTWWTTASAWPAGGALLRGLSVVMSNATGLETRVADDR